MKIYAKIINVAVKVCISQLLSFFFFQLKLILRFTEEHSYMLQ